jgi:hypothetical protein
LPPPTPTASTTVTGTPAPSPTQQATATPTATASTTVTPTPTATRTPTATAQASATVSPTATPTVTGQPTPTPADGFVLGYFASPPNTAHVFFEDYLPLPNVRSYLIEVRRIDMPNIVVASRTINVSPPVPVTPYIGTHTFNLPLQDPMEPRSYENDFQYRVRVYDAPGAGGSRINQSAFAYLRAPSADLKVVAPVLGAAPPITVGTYPYQFTDSRPTGSSAYYQDTVTTQTTGVPAIITEHIMLGHGMLGLVTTVHPPVTLNTSAPVELGQRVLYTRPMRNYFKTDGTFISRQTVGQKTTNIYTNGMP